MAEDSKPWENVGEGPEQNWRPRSRDKRGESRSFDSTDADSKRDNDAGKSKDSQGYRDNRQGRSKGGFKGGGFNKGSNRNSTNRSGFNKNNRDNDRRSGRGFSSREDRQGRGPNQRDHYRDNSKGGPRDDKRGYASQRGGARGGNYGRDGQEGRYGAPRGDRGDYGRSRMSASRRGQGTQGRTRHLEIPATVEANQLDRDAWHQLSPLPKETAEMVAKHLIMAGELVDSDAELAYEHAQAALKMAWRIDVVREAVALTAYACGKYSEALREVRTVRRMSGSDVLRAVEADSERGLGNPAKALEIIAATDKRTLDKAARAELAIVESAARADLGDHEVGLMVIENALGKVDAEDDYSRNRLLSVKADRLRELQREEEAEAVEALIVPEPEEVAIYDLQAEIEAEEHANPTSMQGTNVALVEEYPIVMLDLDGVTWHGDTAIEGAVEGIAAARNLGAQVFFLTNNAARPPQAVADKLAGIGIAAQAQFVVNSAQDGVEALKGMVAPDAKVLCVGGPGVRAAVEAAGMRPVFSASEEPEAVLQGLGFDVDWKILSEACYAIEAGATWVATNLDYALPTEQGRAIGNGSFVEAVRQVTRAQPVECGKPQPSIYNLALRRAQGMAGDIEWMKQAFAEVETALQAQLTEWEAKHDGEAEMELSPEQREEQRAAQAEGRRNKWQLRVLRDKTVAVGDQLATDIIGANGARVKSCVVMTGLTKPRQLLLAGDKQRPDFVALDLSDLQRPFSRPTLTPRGWWYVDGALARVNHSSGLLELRGVGKLTEAGLQVSLAEFRALLAAAWYAKDQGLRLECPDFEVVREVEREFSTEDVELLAQIEQEVGADDFESGEDFEGVAGQQVEDAPQTPEVSATLEDPEVSQTLEAAPEDNEAGQ